MDNEVCNKCGKVFVEGDIRYRKFTAIGWVNSDSILLCENCIPKEDLEGFDK